MAQRKFIEDEKRFTGRYARTVYSTLYYSYLPYLWRCVGCLVMGLIGRVLVLSNANIIGFWIDSMCVPSATVHCKAVPSLVRGFSNQRYLILLFAVTFSGLIFSLLYRVIFSRLSALAISRLYDEVTLRTSRYPMAFFDTTPAGRIITRFSSDYGNVFRLFGGPLAEYFSIICDLLTMVVLVTFASPYYLPLCLFIGVLNYVIYRANRDRLRFERRELSIHRAPSIAHFAETAQGAGTIRSYQKQTTFFGRFKNLNRVFLSQRLKTTGRIILFSVQMNALTALLLFLTGGMGWKLTQTGAISIGSLGVAFSFIVLSGNTIQMFFEWMAQFEEAMIGVERLDDYLKRGLEPGVDLTVFADERKVHPDAGRVTLPSAQQRGAPLKVENLWLRYRADLPYVLKGLNFELHAGERIGIVGRTGSGKSSLIQALFHLYPVEQGRITVDGQHARLTPQDETARAVDLRDYRRLLSLITQEPILFKGTLRENLSFDPTLDAKALRDALSRVDLLEWLETHPKGLDRPIDERGRNLSSGEKQLICMARCLLQESPVVIMDEATSAIDPQSEEILVRATNEFFAGRTQIIVAHRLSTLLNCDRVLWLQDGEIKMLGPTRDVLSVFRSQALGVDTL